MPVARRPMMERITPRLDLSGDCWLWTGATNNFGYGVIGEGRNKLHYVHRVVYESVVEKIPAGLVTDHICCQPACVNPDHLEMVTQGENVRRGWATTRSK